MFYPPRCPFCSSLLSSFKGVAGGETAGLAWAGPVELEGLLCQDCLAKVPWLEEERCPRCGQAPAIEAGYCPFCSRVPFAFDLCCVLGHYREGMRAAVHRFKYSGQKSLAPALGELLYLRLKSLPWAASLEAVVPVPLARERLAQRGYNQSFLLAKVLADRLQLPLLNLLEKKRETASQTGLSRAQRKGNVEDVFRCIHTPPTGSNLLLVDDVLTSGATSHAAALLLKDEGASRVGLAVLAR